MGINSAQTFNQIFKMALFQTVFSALLILTSMCMATNRFTITNRGGYVLKVTIDYVSNARAQHFESTANCCGNSVVYELPSDATGITMHADAIAGRQIFRKFYSRVSEILGCQSFTVSGTTLFPDYDNNMGNFGDECRE